MSCELSFIWGKMRTAPQIGLRDCSKRLVGKVNIQDFGEGGVQCNQVLALQVVFC